VYFSFREATFSVESVKVFFVAFTAMHSAYEIGYIVNDVYTVQFEKNPTQRLSKEYFFLMKKCFPIHIAVRMGYLLLSIEILYLMGLQTINAFIICIVILNIVFAFHNVLRERMNIVTMFVLTVLKYISIPILFNNNILGDYLILVFLVPVIRSIEYASKDRFHVGFLRYVRCYKDVFRIKYYFIMFIIVLFSRFFDYRNIYIIGAFFVFRLTMSLIYKVSFIRNKINKIRKKNCNQ
jgi:hypothetical protein